MPTIEDVKQWLSRFAENERQLDNLIERVGLLRSRLEAPGSPTLSGMPHGGGFEADAIGHKLSTIEELEEQAQGLLAKSRCLYKEIDSIILQIKGKDWPNRKVVLQMRYLDRFTLDEVNTVLWGSKADFDDRLESYRRRTFRIHAEALEELRNLVPEGDKK